MPKEFYEEAQDRTKYPKGKLTLDEFKLLFNKHKPQNI